MSSGRGWPMGLGIIHMRLRQAPIVEEPMTLPSRLISAHFPSASLSSHLIRGEFISCPKHLSSEVELEHLNSRTDDLSFVRQSSSSSD